MDHRQLFEIQSQINNNQNELVEFVNLLKSKDIQLPPNFPFETFTPLTVIKAPTIQLDDFSEKLDLNKPNPEKANKKNELMEPVFDPSTLSEMGQRMYKAAELGVPFQHSALRIDKKPIKDVKQESAEAETLNSGTLQIRTVKKLFMQYENDDGNDLVVDKLYASPALSMPSSRNLNVNSVKCDSYNAGINEQTNDNNGIQSPETPILSGLQDLNEPLTPELSRAMLQYFEKK